MLGELEDGVGRVTGSGYGAEGGDREEADRVENRVRREDEDNIVFLDSQRVAQGVGEVGD